MVGGQESTRSTLHLAELFRLADRAGLLADPDRAARRMQRSWRSRGRLMPDISRLSINLATVRQRYSITEALDAVARHGIPAVAPWRDQIAQIGLRPHANTFAIWG